ncbi:MAG: hypothetical protein EHM61_12405 [Acidobacteria bacterium]|nr:MAG: hypothetical protein EHM61_12405 [Acidobacteriota bacterium]
MSRFRYLGAFLACLLIAQTAGGPAPRFDRWRIVGPGGGGTMIRPAVSPHDPNVVIEGCDMTGMYVTLDGARSWRNFNLRAVLTGVAYDPQNADVIYVSNNAVWKSTDRARSWSLIFPNPAKHTVEHMRGDHASQVYTTEDPAYQGVRGIDAIAVDPRNPQSISLAVGGRQGRGLLQSTDGGKSWRRAGELDRDDVLFLLRVDKISSQVLVGTSSGLRTAAGMIQPRTSGPEYLSMAAGGAGNGLVVYATREATWKESRLTGAILVSKDKGKTWEDRSAAIAPLVKATGGDPPRFESVTVCDSRPEVAYLGFRGLRLDDGPLYNGVLKTTDQGQSWAVVRKESDRPAGNSRLTWVEYRAASDWKKQKREDYSVWFDAPVNLAVAPGNPDVCYGTDLFRTYRTTDGGKNWETVNSVPVKGQESWTTRGLDVTTCYGVHFDPFDKSRLYISYTDIGLFRSEDRGKSWIGSTEGIPREWRNTTYWIELDPKVKGLIWGAFGANHDLPRPKMWRQTDPAQYKGGIATSKDGGASWEVTDRGINQSDITHILLDPASPVGSRTLYACGFGDGVFKSTDNGRSWTLKRQGLAGRQPFAWRLARTRDGILYLVVARRSDKGEIGNDHDGTLYRSTDGAEHWERVALPQGTNGPNGLAIDSRDNRRLYLAAWGRATPEGDQGGGIFISNDGGKSWRQVLGDDQHIYDVTVDPRNPDLLYACGFQHSAYRSADRGETWSRIKGYNFKWGHRVIPDANDPAMIYITTFGGSVWHGPALGDPEAPEDIKTVVRKER